MIQFKRIGHRLAASYAALLAVLLISSLLTGLQSQGMGAAKGAMTDDARRLELVSEWALTVRSNLDRAVTATRLDATAGDDAAAESQREQALRLPEVVGRSQLGAANFHAPAPAQFAATPSLNGPPGLGKSVTPAHVAQSGVQRAKAAVPTAHVA